jgi:hypothetical protein
MLACDPSAHADLMIHRPLRAASAALWLAALVLAVPSSSAAQGTFPLDPLEPHQRLLEVLGRRDPQPVGGWNLSRGLEADTADRTDPWTTRRLPAPQRLWGDRLRLQVLPIEFRASHNSDRPWGINDGPVWQGKGLTTSLTGGVTLRWGPLEATARPILWQAGNNAFPLSPYPTYSWQSPFGNPRPNVIDTPQRFGDGPVTRLDPGQSAIRLRYRGAVLGYSTETQRWGPQRLNPILMSQHAGGFGHLYVGTEEPLDIRIGKVHVQWLWGRVTESAFFDTSATNGSRYLTGATASFFPAFAPGLELGVNRAFMSRWRNGGPTLRQALEVWMPVFKVGFADSTNPGGNDRRDQLASVFLRWVAPAAGFEIYGEWARGDHSWDLRDFLLSPEHASGFALGFQKTFRATPERFWHLGGELTVLGAPRTTNVRGGRFFYYNSGTSFRQGYTQRGQILGAGIGPGSSQLALELGRVTPKGRTGMTIQRTVYENDLYYRLFSASRDFWRYQAEPALTVDALRFLGPWELGGSATVAKLLNKYYVRDRDETNLQLSLLTRYRWGTR